MNLDDDDHDRKQIPAFQRAPPILEENLNGHGSMRSPFRRPGKKPKKGTGVSSGFCSFFYHTYVSDTNATQAIDETGLHLIILF